MSCEKAVREFMMKNFQHINGSVADIPDDVKILRLRLMTEELGEVAQAMHERKVIDIADGLCDLVYVVVGTAIAYGMPFDALFAEVHRSNMTKPALDANNKGGKVRKGDTAFEPPRLDEILFPLDPTPEESKLPFLT